MSILGDIRSALTYRPADPPPAKQSPSDNGRRFVQIGLEGLARRDRYDSKSSSQSIAETLALVSSWTFGDITLITRRLTSRKAGLHIKRQEGESTIDIVNHPFERLLRNPNSLMSGPFLRSLTWFWCLLRGEAFVFVSTMSPGMGEPEELWPIMADLVTPLPQTLRRAKDGPRLIIDYAYTPDPNRPPQRLPGENVLHLRFPNPRDFWRGLSPLSAGYLPLQSDQAQARWLRDWYKENNAHPAFIAAVPEEMTDTEFEKAREDFFDKFQNGLGTAFTRSGDLNVTVIQQTLEQMKLLDAREFTQGEIDRIYGVPAGIHGESLSGDSRQALETLFAENTIQPLLDMEAAAWTTAVVQTLYTPDLMVEANNIIPRDRAIAVQEYHTFSQDRTIAENRRLHNLPPIVSADPTLQFAIDNVPIRLIDPLNASGYFMAPGGAPDGRVRDVAPPPGVPSMSSSLAPQLVVAEESARSVVLPGNGHHAPDASGAEMIVLPNATAAIDAAIKQELRRWRKVALRLLARQGNATARPFTSDILPPELQDSVDRKLGSATTAEGVRAIFFEWLGNGSTLATGPELVTPTPKDP